MTNDQYRLSRREVAGIQIEIAEIGAGSPLLFLHAGESPLMYDDAYLRGLAGHFHVIAPTHPGFGRSDRPSDFRTVEDLSNFYLTLARDFGLQDAVLAGASFGGWLAAEIAIRSTQRFSHLVLAGPLGIKVGDREARDIFDLHSVPPLDWPDYFFADSHKFCPNFVDWKEEDLVAVARSREALTLYAWKPYMHNPRLRRWLSRIDIPTLVLAGADDRIVSSNYSREYAALIPGCALEIVENAGHFVHIEQPDYFGSRVRQFASDLKGIAAQAA